MNDLLPSNEQIGRALRQEVRMYPEIAVRELVANALIQQDFTITGTGPMIEIFPDRVEITNPAAIPAGAAKSAVLKVKVLTWRSESR